MGRLRNVTRRRRGSGALYKASGATLASLGVGEKAIVEWIVAGPGAARRLADMGLTPGTEVKIVRRGPLGGPIQVEVRGTSLALGYGLASKVLVRRERVREVDS